MLEWEKFPKIRYLFDDVIPAGNVVYSEKLDGSNAGIVLDPAEKIIFLHGRRTPVATFDGDGDIKTLHTDYRGFVAYVGERIEPLVETLKNLDHRVHIYGEWLVPHAIRYPDEMYERFYVFPSNSPDALAVSRELPFEQIEVYNYGPGEMLTPAEAEKVVRNLAERLGRKVEGVIFHWQYAGVLERAKWVTKDAREEIKAKWGSQKAVEDPHMKMASMIHARSIVKVWEKVHDELGREPGEKDIPRLLGRLLQEFAEEWFWKTAKKSGWPTVNTMALKRAIETKGRDIYLDRIRFGEWPVPIQHQLWKGR